MICVRSLFDRDETRSDFVISHVLKHWSGPADAPPANAQDALVVVAPLSTPPFYEKRYIEEALPLLARRNYRGVVDGCALPHEFHLAGHMLFDYEHVCALIASGHIRAVAVIGDMLTPQVRGTLLSCSQGNMQLINWSREGSTVDSYLRRLWRS